MDSVNNSYWHARSPEFFSQPAVRLLEWLRLPGDILFIVGGILPVVYLAIRMFLNRNRAGEVPTGAAVESFTEQRPERG